MANIKSQIKRNRQNEKAHQRNKSAESALKTSIRKFNEAVTKGEENLQTMAQEVGRQLDKAAAKGVLHKNQAANRKSALAKKAAASKK
ncbi:MAG: 30S ribosomal protein S20 [Candidatus Nanopelagicales bacterium]